MKGATSAPVPGGDHHVPLQYAGLCAQAKSRIDAPKCTRMSPNVPECTLCFFARVNVPKCPRARVRNVPGCPEMSPHVPEIAPAQNEPTAPSPPPNADDTS